QRLHRHPAQLLAVRAARRHRRRRALLHRLRPGAPRRRLPAQPARRRRAVRPVRQHRSGFLMRWLRLLVWIMGSVVLLVTLAFVGLQTPPGKVLVAGFASSDSIKIECVSGFVPVDMQIAKIELRDKQGAWLTLNDT